MAAAVKPRRAASADYHHWSAADDEIVRTGVERGDGAVEIGAKIGASAGAVYNRVTKLGIRHPRMSRPLEVRFFQYVSPEPNSGCWLWDGSAGSLGYGQLRVARSGPGSIRAATHISLEIHGRPVPTGMRACHRCDNPCCVNPDHLFIGTQKDNIGDAINKGRLSKPPLAVKGQGRLKETCRAGHSLAEVGVYVSKGGVQSCKACRRLAKTAFMDRLKAAGLTCRGRPPVVRP